ncbi:MAG TPA: phosphate ABC transporter permease subunit PstC [Kofleriaceae bacterium]|nr:phosphate ABC transporter permease subunit PstC [Kofleriaceae bacterium]
MAEKPHVDLSGSRDTADRAFNVLAIAAATLVLLILGLIAVTMTQRASSVFGKMGLEFFTSKRWSPPDGQFGGLSFIWGTIYTSAIAIALAVPVSLAVALFITQLAPRRLKMPLVYVLDLLAVVPSVVFGLWGVLTLAGPIQGVYTHIHNVVGGIPILGSIFGDTPQGRSFMTAGIILAIMITPIITSLAREVIETTPATEKEAAYALGATRWEMIRGSIIPHSKGGIVGAVMLGLGRAMGETIAAALVIGASVGQISINVFSSGNSMPAVIANEWGEADDLHKSGLIALAVVLFAITIIVNVIASAIVRRSMARSRGART